jgi:hypothetical protein
MLPEDYYGFDYYEVKKHNNITQLANRLNKKESTDYILDEKDYELLKDKEYMAELLIDIEFEKNEETISLKKLKELRDSEIVKQFIS